MYERPAVLPEDEPAAARRAIQLARLAKMSQDQADPHSTGVIRATAFDINTVPEPENTGDFDARVASERLDVVNASEHFRAAIYAGVKLGNEEAKWWPRLMPMYSPNDSMLVIAGSFVAVDAIDAEDRRLSLRVIPDWKQPEFDTPYSVVGKDNNLELLYRGYNGATRRIGEFVNLLAVDSMSDVYIRAGRSHGDNGIVMNPIMTCPHRCLFCSRQYDSMHRTDSQEPAPLMVFGPEEIVEYTANKFPDLNWRSIGRISLVTGSFNTFDEMEEYTGRLSKAITERTGGNFAPADNKHQEILVLTHLARNRRHFEVMRKLGVAIQDTIEIIDDERREQVMPVKHKPAVPKYEYSFDDIIASIPDAIRVLGKDNYRATVILGLDTYDTTTRGLQMLGQAGLRRLYYPMFQPYGYDDHTLYKMSFEDIRRSIELANNLFARVY